MRAFAAALLLFLGTPQQAPIATGAIEGRVVRASNAENISGVQVILTPPAAAVPSTPVPPEAQQQISALIQRGVDAGASQAQIDNAVGNLRRNLGLAPPEPTVTTDADGKFSFRNLAPGTYAIRAQKPGYFGPIAPAVGTYSSNVAKVVTVENEKVATVDFGLVQGGVVRGVVRDPDGERAPNYAVVTARPGYANGRYIWLLTGAMNADDRGEYRWPNFPPGDYYIGVGPRAPGPIANVQDSWARVFYPGTIDPNQGRPITIPEGGEVTVDLAAQVRPWNVYKISGVALNPLPNLTPDRATGIVNRASTLVLMPYKLTPLDNPPITMWTNLVATNAKPNGEFVLSNVDPGRYELYAMAVDNQNRRVWTGHMTVEVTDKDITGLNIAISPGVTLRGEVTITGSPTVKPEMVRVNLQALDTLPPQVAQAAGTIAVDQLGKLSIANLSEGRYRLQVQVPGAPDSYVTSIQHGGVNVFDEGFTLDARNADVPFRIDINTSGETVEGNVRDQAKEAPNAVVVLVPAAGRRMNPAYYKMTLTDDKGHFVIRGVAPGAYTVFAWQSILPGAYLNAEFLDKYQTRGRALNVQGGSRNELQLELIR